MVNDNQENHVYLGDAVYAQWDGEHCILRTDSHLDTECRDKIYLDRDVLTHLFQFVIWQKVIDLKG